MNRIRILGAGAIAAVLLAAGAFVPATADTATPVTATIHPGVMTFTAGAQCTANFVFTDTVTHDVFIGQAAHCSGTGASTDTNGCTAGTLPVGTEVEVDGAEAPATMVYNSWATMQSVHEADADTCAFNDFALLRLAPGDRDAVDPSIPVWGGPVGIGGPTAAGETVYSYGNSSLRQGLAPLSPKTGISLGSTPSGWSHPVYTVTPGIPGDSGSAFLDAQGNALGILSTLAIAPIPASNNVSDLGKALTYMQAHGFPNVQLVQGRSFTGTAGLLTGLLAGGIGGGL